jgi:NADPH-dependent 2,4-dienoyl-CoA reductase/sulfur reductase-like enzyme
MKSSNLPNRTVIVGASLAGIRCAASLRRLGYQEEIVLLGEERHLPYQRPPLSKAVLTGRASVGRATLRSQVSAPFDLRLGVSARGLDTSAHTLRLTNDSTISYRNLVITCGARPRQLAALTPSETTIYFRTLDDAIALRSRLEDSRGTVLIVGAGFIGSEIASSALERGWSVTLVDLDQRMMARALGPSASATLEDLHRDRGVDLRVGTSVHSLQTTGTHPAIRAELSDSSVLDVDLVVVGVGVIPNTDWLSDSSVTLRDGIVADAYGRVEGVEDVYTAGDVASWFHPLYGRHLRFEHFESATNQAQTVASTIVSQNPEPLSELPFAWSEQYDNAIQFLGLPDPSAIEHALNLTGDPSHGHSFGYFVDDQLQAAVLIDRSSQLAVVRDMITANLKR